MSRIRTRRWWTWVAALSLAWGTALTTLAVDPRATATGDEEPARDWQAWVDAEAWTFAVEATQPLYCALERNGKFGAYEVHLRVAKGGDRIDIDVIEAGAVKYTWPGHRNSVFAITGTRLHYVEFSRSVTGAHLVAVDLVSGERLWRERCLGIGVVAHSGYRNLVTLDVAHDVAIVRGRESLGRYIEVKRLLDGQTVGHRVTGKAE